MANPEARENNSPNINRLTHPEFVGTYYDPGPARFQIYLLEIDSFPYRLVGEHAEVLARRASMFDGVIRDQIGLAACNGSIIEGVSIAFKKTYFESARRRSGIIGHEILYQGEYDQNSRIYKGAFNLIGTDISGAFTLRSTRLPTV